MIHSTTGLVTRVGFSTTTYIGQLLDLALLDREGCIPYIMWGAVEVICFLEVAPLLNKTIEHYRAGGREGEDLTVVPSETQKTLLPPDRFARPPSEP